MGTFTTGDEPGFRLTIDDIHYAADSRAGRVGLGAPPSHDRSRVRRVSAFRTA